jgi:hypothetical protein
MGALNQFITYSSIGFAGALCLELFKLYELREKLARKKSRALFQSPVYWIATLGMLCASGILAWLINASVQNPTPWQLAIAGIAGRSLLRVPGEVTAAKGKLHAGRGDSTVDLLDVFR